MRLSSVAPSVWLSTVCLLSRAVSALSDDDLRYIPSVGDDFNIKTGKLLAPILIPRVPGTEGQIKTQEHFANFFKSELPDWTLTWQNSTSKTPVSGNKDVPFHNMIFHRDPHWASAGDTARLTLVAHYDSKYSPEGFIGATDSAAPCAMLLHVARSIDKALAEKWKKMEQNGEADPSLEAAAGVQIIFLDGEEAFLQWTDDDSLYGARSLAESWEQEFHPTFSTFRTKLSSISLFVLLDLLGSPNPNVPSYFLTTHWAYRKMADLEKRLRALGLLEAKARKPFLPDAEKNSEEFRYSSGIQDDHIPFMRRGVDILHMIAYPFPPVWHTMDDDGEHLDIYVTKDWAKIVTAFAAEWLELDGLLEKPETPSKRTETTPLSSERTEL